MNWLTHPGLNSSMIKSMRTQVQILHCNATILLSSGIDFSRFLITSSPSHLASVRGRTIFQPSASLEGTCTMIKFIFICQTDSGGSSSLRGILSSMGRGGEQSLLLLSKTTQLKEDSVSLLGLGNLSEMTPKQKEKKKSLELIGPSGRLPISSCCLHPQRTLYLLFLNLILDFPSIHEGPPFLSNKFPFLCYTRRFLLLGTIES